MSFRVPIAPQVSTAPRTKEIAGVARATPAIAYDRFQYYCGSANTVSEPPSSV